MSTGLAPLSVTLGHHAGALGATNDAELSACVAPFTGTIASIVYVPDALITGANTNFRSFSVINHGANGAGNTIAGSIDLTVGVNAPANAQLNVTLSGTAANLNVNAGDVLTFKSYHTGTGLADPGGLFLITLARS